MKAYAIKDPKGYMFYGSLCRLRGSCITLFINKHSRSYAWKDLYKKGYRCVPVLITEVKTDK